MEGERRVSLQPGTRFNLVINERRLILDCDAIQGWNIEQVPNEAEQFRIRSIGDNLNLAVRVNTVVEPNVILVPLAEEATQRWRMVPTDDGKFLFESVAVPEVYLVGDESMEIARGKMSIRVIKFSGMMDSPIPSRAKWNIEGTQVSLRLRQYNMVRNGEDVMMNRAAGQGWEFVQVPGAAQVFHIRNNGENVAVTVDTVDGETVVGPGVSLVAAGEEPTPQELAAQSWERVPIDGQFLLRSMVDPDVYLAAYNVLQLRFDAVYIEAMRISNVMFNPDRALAKWNIVEDPLNGGLFHVSFVPRPFNMVANEPSVVLNCNATQGWNFEQVPNEAGQFRIRNIAENLNLAVRVNMIGDNMAVGPGVILVTAGGAPTPLEETAQRWRMVPIDGQFQLQSVADPQVYLGGEETSPDLPPHSGQMCVRTKSVPAKWNIVEDAQNGGLRHVSFLPRPFNMASGEMQVLVKRSVAQNCIFEHVDNEAGVYRIRLDGSLPNIVTLDVVQGSQTGGNGSRIILSLPAHQQAGVGRQRWRIVPFEGKSLLQSVADPTLYLAGRYLPHLSEAAGDIMEVEAALIQNMDSPHLVRAKWDISDPPPPPTPEEARQAAQAAMTAAVAEAAEARGAAVAAVAAVALAVAGDPNDAAGTAATAAVDVVAARALATLNAAWGAALWVAAVLANQAAATNAVVEMATAVEEAIDASGAAMTAVAAAVAGDPNDAAATAATAAVARAAQRVFEVRIATNIVGAQVARVVAILAG